MNLPRNEQELKELCVDFTIFYDAYNGNKEARTESFDKWLKERNKPKLYDGLTKEQWDIVAKDELLCEFWDDKDNDNCISKFSKLRDGPDVEFYSDEYASWKHCRIHHSQPQFNTGKKPDWLDDEQSILCRTNAGILIRREAGSMFWELDVNSPIVRWQAVKA